MSTPHPDQETLAELADSDESVGSAQAAEIRAHVADCAQCAADLAAIRDLRATLRALPPIPMPADVAARLEAALSAAAAPEAGAADVTPTAGAAADVVPFARPARTRRTREFPLGAAAAVVIVLAVGAVAIGISSKGESKKSATAAASSSAAATTTAPPTTVLASGTDYTGADIRSQVVAVVDSAAPDAANQFGALRVPNEGGASAAAAAPASAPAPAAAASASASAAPSFAAPTAQSSAPAAAGSVPSAPSLTTLRTAPSGPLADPAALARCIQTLVGKPEQPVLVDYATFNGVPSTIIVLPDPDVDGKLDIYVEADNIDCASQVTFLTFLPPPSSPAP